MKTLIITILSLLGIIFLPTTLVKADPIDMRNVDSLAHEFCHAVADESASLIPAFDKQYGYFEGYTSLDHQLVGQNMAKLTSYAVTEVCPQLKSAAASKVQSLYEWLEEQSNSGELNRVQHDVKTEMLTIGAAIEILPF